MSEHPAGSPTQPGYPGAGGLTQDGSDLPPRSPAEAAAQADPSASGNPNPRDPWSGVEPIDEHRDRDLKPASDDAVVAFLSSLGHHRGMTLELTGSQRAALERLYTETGYAPDAIEG